MKTHLITKDQLDSDNNYIGSVDLSNFDGNLESEENLGYVKFKSLQVLGQIYFRAGSGIKADEGIEAEFGIKAGEGIEAGFGIKAGEGIEAGNGIIAGWGIEAGNGIIAGFGIKAGEGIEAGFGIAAGLSIVARFISSGSRIFAGVTTRKIPTNEEMEIRAELRQGTIAFGKLVELEETKKEGKQYV